MPVFPGGPRGPGVPGGPGGPGVPAWPWSPCGDEGERMNTRGKTTPESCAHTAAVEDASPDQSSLRRRLINKVCWLALGFIHTGMHFSSLELLLKQCNAVFGAPVFPWAPGIGNSSVCV